jgi:hypothetical protein
MTTGLFQLFASFSIGRIHNIEWFFS